MLIRKQRQLETELRGEGCEKKKKRAVHFELGEVDVAQCWFLLVFEFQVFCSLSSIFLS